MATKHIWRPGDQCRILRPLWVKRVGYPLVWHELMDEVKADPRVGQAWATLHAEPAALARAVSFLRSGFTSDPTEGVPRYFLQAAAKALVEARGFGGNERSLHYFTEEEARELWLGHEGDTFTVAGKRIVKTGTRFASASGVTHTSDGPDDWDEPGGLADMKTHILLTTSGGKIEAVNVELVDKTAQV